MSRLRAPALALLVLALLALAVWLLPIQGQVLVATGPQASVAQAWPQIWTDPPVVRPSEPVTIYVRDSRPWAYVRLELDGQGLARDESYDHGSGPWTWRWVAPSPPADFSVAFYHSCQAGCVERGRASIGAVSAAMPPTPVPPRPTKLGVVFASPARDWHGRAGWAVELTYAREAEVDFNIDELARRVHMARQQGLRVLVRVDYARSQSLPPVGDELALARFLDYCAQLARDDRLRDVYGYVIGAGFNAASESALAPDAPTTPEWYARVLSGYGLPTSREDTAAQVIRAQRPAARVLVGPVAPWVADQGGGLPDPLGAPWLSYMNTLVAHIDEAAQAREAAGMPSAAPDGFALRAAGRVDPADSAAAQEPSADIYDPRWGQAQMGFRVYRDWLAIINRYPATRGLPAFITSANTTAAPGMAPPTQSYPAGWLSAALAEVEREPQVRALCWFVDAPLGGQWGDYSLAQHPGMLNDAAAEFDRLLQR